MSSEFVKGTCRVLSVAVRTRGYLPLAVRDGSSRTSASSTPNACPTRKGNVLSPADMGPPEGHPTTTEVCVELEDLGGRTKMVMTYAGVPGDSPGAAGWAMALEKLAAHAEAHSDR